MGMRGLDPHLLRTWLIRNPAILLAVGGRTRQLEAVVGELYKGFGLARSAQPFGFFWCRHRSLKGRRCDLSRNGVGKSYTSKTRAPGLRGNICWTKLCASNAFQYPKYGAGASGHAPPPSERRSDRYRVAVELLDREAVELLPRIIVALIGQNAERQRLP
jgi:hypothetical protein